MIFVKVITLKRPDSVLRNHISLRFIEYFPCPEMV